MTNSKLFVLLIVGLVQFGRGENESISKGLIKRKRPAFQSQSSYGSPCYGYDEVDEDRKGKGALLAAAGGAAIGYYLGMKHQESQQPIIYNNVYNEYSPPCISTSGGWGGGGSSGGGGGIVGGILGHHPILSNLIQGVQGNLLNGNGLGGWISGATSSFSSSSSSGSGSGFPNRINGNNINWNRIIRQFTRVVRVIT